MKTASVICTFWLGLALSASAQSTIAYFNGPAFQFPADYASASIDFDKDGTGDFSFATGTPRRKVSGRSQPRGRSGPTSLFSGISGLRLTQPSENQSEDARLLAMITRCQQAQTLDRL